MPKKIENMAQVKKDVAKAMKRGENVREILTGWNKKSEVVKAFLWWFCFKLSAVWNKIRGMLLALISILLWVLALILGTILTLVVTAVVVVTSPLWLPIRMRYAAPKVAKLLLNTEVGKLKSPEDLPVFIMAAIWSFGCRVLNFVWRPVYNRLPMAYRQWFIKEDDKPLKGYELQTQLDYYVVQSKENKVEVIRQMSKKAMRQLWNGGKVADRENILEVYYLGEEDGIELLKGSNDQFNLLLRYCENEKKNLTQELQLVFVEALNGEQERAFKVLKDCAEKRKLEKATLLALIELLGSNVGEQVEEILNIYWSKNTLSNEVVKALIEASTDNFVDEKKSRAYALLLKAVRRDGLSTELAELFYERCDNAQEKEMDYLIKMLMDIQIIDWQCINEDNDEHRAKLTQYFNSREKITPEGQVLMREWQYRIFCDTHHELDEKVLNELLVKRNLEKQSSYFKAVFLEGISRGVITETTMKLLVMVTWKRDIVLSQAIVL